ncbi:MAG TPA: hypothetical protein VGO16_12510 [Pseudonocardiaceae bacterium]|nr:hypothetical protein [Pseudonocardiaceae bacterium]
MRFQANRAVSETLAGRIERHILWPLLLRQRLSQRSANTALGDEAPAAQLLGKPPGRRIFIFI